MRVSYLMNAPLLGMTALAAMPSSSVGNIVVNPSALNTSQVIDQSFLGFATEASSFPSFTYTNFSQNLFNVFHDKVGAPIIFRVGGTSMDHSIFDMNQEKDAKYPQGRYHGLQSNVTFGKNWFKGFDLENLQFLVHVPLARNNRTNAVKFTQQCLDTMSDIDKLYALEIGNEVDLYAEQCFNGTCIRNPETWDPKPYAQEVQEHIDLLTKHVTGLPQTGRIFQIFDKANGPQTGLSTNTDWRIKPVMGNVSDVVDLTRVKQVAQHYYQTHTDKNHDLQSALLSHVVTTSTTQRKFEPSIKYLQRKNPELDFVLDEVGNAIGDCASDAACDILKSSLGSAVWTVDWMLYAMSINVDRINMQMGREFGYAAWQPNPHEDNPPHLNGPFYGHVFVADFISNKGNLTVAELPQPAKNKNISAYAGFHDGKLAKIALTNQELWTGPPGNRSVANVSLNLQALGDDVPGQVKVEKLWGPNGDSLKNITWAGLDWPFNNHTGGGTPIRKRNDTEYLTVLNGSVKVSLGATTAALITW